MTEHPKEHGLLFKPDMVRAYLAGNKSMTRRVITRRNSYVDGEPASKEVWNELQFDRAWIDRGPSPAGNAGPYLKVPRPWIENGKQVDESVHRVYPRYQVGDTIWGRETFALSIFDPDTVEPDTKNPNDWDPPVYKADNPMNEWCRQEIGKDGLVRDAEKIAAPWRPSIFMPRWASRIVTPILAVRPERVWDISEEDAVAEGVAPKPDELIWTVLKEDGGTYQCFTEPKDKDGIRDYVKSNLPGRTATEGFRNLWDKINGKKYPWSNNDWVWAISFKAYEK